MRIPPLRTFLVLCVLIVWTAAGQQKLAQTGMKFLNVGADARAASLGEALTSVEGNASAMFYNPAGMARLTDRANFTLGNIQYIADIQHYTAGVAIAPFKGEYGVIGLFVHYVDYGEFQGTIRADNAQGFIDMGAFYPSALAAGVSYARALNDKFSVGGSAKYVRQSLGVSINAQDAAGGLTRTNNVAEVVAFDFGILYRTGFKSLNFGMAVRNFSKEVQYEKEGFQLPLTFRIGLSMNVLDFLNQEKPDHAVLVTFDAEHPRDFAEMVRLGVEYTLQDFLSFRVGYISPQDENKMSYGIGFHRKADGQTMGIGFDYAYTPFGIFGQVHRVNLQFAL